MSLALIGSRGAHDRPGGWTPKQLGTLSLWLDADDATTITIATGVSQWNDKSGNGYHVSQGTGSNQPAYVTNVRNGRAAVRFDGTDDRLSGGDVLDLGTGNVSVIAAFNTNSDRFLLTKTFYAVDGASEWGFFTAYADVRQGTTTVRTSFSGTGNKIAAWVLDRSASSTAWRNGTQTDQDTGSPFPNTDAMNSAASFVVGAQSSLPPSFNFNSDLYEAVISLSTWTTTERQQLEGYLAHKWGLAGNLPSDHPYKSIAP